MPPEKELCDVLAFIDREAAKIDALIAEQQRLIALLAEKRQATISHAVTKGLNPDVPMKDSGIEWLGEVPEHWEVKRIKRICSLLKDGTHLPPARVINGIPLLSVRNVINGQFVFREDDSMISEESFTELCRSFVPGAGDVLLAIVGATLGKTAIVPNNMGPFQIQRSLAIFRTHSHKVLPSWLNLVFGSNQFQKLLWEFVGYSAQPGIYLNTLANFSIPVPNEEEQSTIVAFLDGETAQLDTLTAEAQRAITLLQERRMSLISAAVTGKIDVRSISERDAA